MILSNFFLSVPLQKYTFFTYKLIPQIEFIAPDIIAFDGRPNTTFIPYNNVPLGIAPYNDERLFIGVARRSPGIASTLNYINLNAVSANQSPLLNSYPDVETNRLDVS